MSTNMERALERVAQILSYRFDCQVRFLAMNEISDSARDREIVEVSKRNENSQMIINRKDLLLPIKSHGELNLIAVLEGAGRLLPSQMEHVRHALDLVLSGLFADPMTRPTVLSIEDQISSTSELANSEKTDSYAIAEQDRLANPRIPLLIEAPRASYVRELALEIHRLSNQHFFLALSDLSADTLQNVDDLIALGGMTLFIPDVTKVDRRLQALLAEYLATVDLDLRDLRVIASCEGDIFSLVQMGLVDPDFAQAIQGGYMKWPENIPQGSSISDTLDNVMTALREQRRPRLQIISNDLH